MLKIGLTGNYFSGFEKVGNVYRNMGVPIFDADLIIKFMFYNNSITIDKIRAEFGKSVFKDNFLNMDAFRNPERFHTLVRVIELDLIRAYEKWRLSNSNAKFTIFKTQILFEMNWNNIMNMNIVVFRPNGLRVNDIQTKQGLKTTEVYNMIDNEMDPLQKNELSNYVIHNYASCNDTIERQIEGINKSILAKSVQIETGIWETT